MDCVIKTKPMVLDASRVLKKSLCPIVNTCMVLLHMVLMHGPHAWSSCMVLMHGPLH